MKVSAMKYITLPRASNCLRNVYSIFINKWIRGSPPKNIQKRQFKVKISPFDLKFLHFHRNDNKIIEEMGRGRKKKSLVELSMFF